MEIVSLGQDLWRKSILQSPFRIPLLYKQNPFYVYASAGSYTVSLTATNSYGSDVETKSNYITVGGTGEVPVADFIASKSSVNVGESVQFTDLSNNSPTSWSWNFGDGGTSTLQNPSHAYSTAGTYTVSLTVSNGNGSDTESKSGYITVNQVGQAPVVDFSASRYYIYEGESVEFTDETINDPTSWYWEFTDGATSENQHPVHVFNKAGKYNIKLTASNAFGGMGLIKDNYITVYEAIGGNETGSLTDSRDGQVYNTVKIGDQWWMAENLAYLPSVSPSSEESRTEPIFYVYDYQGISVTTAEGTNNYSTYGVLYNWTAAQDVCQSGWNLPSEFEWQDLEASLGMPQAIILTDEWRGTNEGGMLKEAGTLHWTNPNAGATNETGFSALPSGYVIHGEFNTLHEFVGFWSSTTGIYSTAAYYRALSYDRADIRRANYKVKDAGYTVRCLED